jgi:hypothetical protein
MITKVFLPKLVQTLFGLAGFGLLAFGLVYLPTQVGKGLVM